MSVFARGRVKRSPTVPELLRREYGLERPRCAASAERVDAITGGQRISTQHEPRCGIRPLEGKEAQAVRTEGEHHRSAANFVVHRTFAAQPPPVVRLAR